MGNERPFHSQRAFPSGLSSSDAERLFSQFRNSVGPSVPSWLWAWWWAGVLVLVLGVGRGCCLPQWQADGGLLCFLDGWHPCLRLVYLGWCLCAKNRVSEAQNILQKIASSNQAKLPSRTLVLVPHDHQHEHEHDNDHHYHHHEQQPSNSEHARSLSLSLSPSPSPSLNVNNNNMDQLPPCHLTSSSFSTLFSSKLIRTTLLLWILFFGNCFSYYAILLLTSQLSVEQTSSTNLYLVVFITRLAELRGILVFALIVDRLGRKLSLLVMFALACFFLFPLAFPHFHSSTLTVPLLFGARMSTIATFIVACIYAPELYPTSVRACGTRLASAMGRIGGMGCLLVAVGLVAASHQTAAMLLFEFVLLLTALSILFFQSATKGQALNDTHSA